jgi:hypothetical protein
MWLLYDARVPDHDLDEHVRTGYAVTVDGKPDVSLMHLALRTQKASDVRQ